MAMKTIKAALNDKVARSLGKNQRVHHGRGLYLQRQSGEVRTWILVRRIKGVGNRQVWVTLGKYPETSIDEAAEMAAAYRKKMDQGIDPRIGRSETVTINNAGNEAGVVTLGEYCDRIWSRSSSKTKRPRSPITIANYKSAMRCWLPELMATPIRNIRADDIEDAYFRCLRTAEPSARKIHRILLSVVNAARREKAADGKPYILPDIDPLSGIANERMTTRRREAFLSVAEIQRGLRGLMAAAYKSNSFSLWSSCHATQLLLLTGMRLSEILSIEERDIYDVGDAWFGDDVEEPFVAIRLRKKQSDTPVLHTIPLTPMIESVITAQRLIKQMYMRRTNRRSPFLFPAYRDNGKPIQRIDDAMFYMNRAILDGYNGYEFQQRPDTAGEGELSAHWTRHSFVTNASAIGFSLLEIEDAQGKAPPARMGSTAHYLHQTDPTRLSSIFTAIGVLYGFYERPKNYRNVYETGEIADVLANVSQSNYMLQYLLAAQFGDMNVDDDEFEKLLMYDADPDSNEPSLRWHLREYIAQENYSSVVRTANLFTPPKMQWPDIELFNESGHVIRQPFGEGNRITF